MNRTSASVLSACCGCLLVGATPGHARADIHSWAAGSSGNWSGAANWSPNIVPSLATHDADISVPGTYIVTQNVASVSIRSILLGNPATTLRLGGNSLQTLLGIDCYGIMEANTGSSTLVGAVTWRPGAEMRVRAGAELRIATSAANDGLMTINSNGNASPATLNLQQSATFSGSGQIRLNGTPDSAVISGAPAAVLGIGPSQVVAGKGRIAAPFQNDGTIRADVAGKPLEIVLPAAGWSFSSGLIEAAPSSLLVIAEGQIDLGSTGRLVADNAEVRIQDAQIRGGRIESLGSGVVRLIGSGNRFYDTTVDASVELTTASTLAIRLNSFTNNGSIVARIGTTATPTTIQFLFGMPVEGNGTWELQGNPSAQTVLKGSAGAHVAFGPGQLIKGSGLLSFTSMDLAGRIEAEGPGKYMNLAANIASSGLIRAGDRAFLQFHTITQSEDARIEADNATIQLGNLTGGRLDAINGGKFLTYGFSYISDCVASGPFDIRAGTDIAIGGVVTFEDATITLAPAAPTIGAIRVHDHEHARMQGTCLVSAGQGSSIYCYGTESSLTFGPDVTVRGYAAFSGAMFLEGTLDPAGDSHASISCGLMTYRPGARLLLDLIDHDTFDQLTGGRHSIDNATLVVRIAPGFIPAVGQSFPILTTTASGTPITGHFANVIVEGAPAARRFTMNYAPKLVTLTVTCTVDVNADGESDILDFLDYLDSFGACDGLPAPCAGASGVNADFNGDTLVDILDFLDFLDAFGQGC